MLNQFYHRVSTATVLTLMLMVYYHLEKVGDRSQTPQWNFWIEKQISFLSSTTEKAMKLLEYECSKTSSSKALMFKRLK